MNEPHTNTAVPTAPKPKPAVDHPVDLEREARERRREGIADAITRACAGEFTRSIFELIRGLIRLIIDGARSSNRVVVTFHVRDFGRNQGSLPPVHGREA